MLCILFATNQYSFILEPFHQDNVALWNHIYQVNPTNSSPYIPPRGHRRFSNVLWLNVFGPDRSQSNINSATTHLHIVLSTVSFSLFPLQMIKSPEEKFQFTCTSVEEKKKPWLHSWVGIFQTKILYLGWAHTHQPFVFFDPPAWNP